MSLGEKIKQLRRQLNLSQEKLAEQLSVHSNTIRKWEKGFSSPDANEVQMLAKALNTSTSFLYGENSSVSFVKNSAYQDKTEIQDNIPSMGYWGSLVDNAEKAAESKKNLRIIVDIVNTALDILKTALNEEEENEKYISVKRCV